MEDHLTRRKPGRGKGRRADSGRAGSEQAESDTMERRLHPRVPVSWPVRLWVDGAAVAGRTVDVSERGLCIVVSGRTAGIETGATCRLDVIMGPKHEVTVQVEVRYLVDSVVGLRTRQRLKLV
jgi:hypothetical protein